MACAVVGAHTIDTVSIDPTEGIRLRFESWIRALIKILTLSLNTLALAL